MLYISTGEDAVAREDTPNGLVGTNPDSWLEINKNTFFRGLKIFLSMCVLLSGLGIARDEISKLSFKSIRIRHLDLKSIHSKIEVFMGVLSAGL